MAELKTQKTGRSVAAFLNAVPDEQRRRDAKKLAALMTDITGEKAAMWGERIVGFGSYDYTYATGHSGTAGRVGFALRRQGLTIYLSCGHAGSEELLAKLGPHRLGKACLYLRKLDDVDLDVLRELIADSYERTVSFDLRPPRD